VGIGLRAAKVAAARSGKREYERFDEALRRHLGFAGAVEQIWAGISPEQAPSEDEAAQIAAEELATVRAERTTHRAGWALPDPTKVVVDPDAWVSAVTNPFGVPARVVEAVITGEIVAVVTQHLLDELAAVLIRPKFRRWLFVADAVSFVETMGGYADLYPDSGARTRRVRDPDDDYLVALAEASAAVIVTGDADLLDADLQPPAITPRDP